MKVLYVVYWGAAEPLGQSLVLPAVKKLARLGVDLTLVTFEKGADLACNEETARIKAGLDEHGVRWIPLRYHKRPKIPATAFDFAQGCVRTVLTGLRERPDVIHARTFLGGLIGLTLAPSLRAKFIYHNEGFYPDEQVDAGLWKAESTAHRFAKTLERQLYSRADGIVVLSRRSKSVVEEMSSIRRKATPVIVVPSCVDLNHFRWNPSPRPAADDTLRFVYAGSVGGRYSLDRIGRFVAVTSGEGKRAHLRVLTRSEPGLVASMLNGCGLAKDAWSINSVPYRVMPTELARQDVGLHFLQQGLSDHGGSPTKIGEYWAAGLPVVVTPNAGDTDEIIRLERVGVIAEEHSNAAYRAAIRELLLLLADPDTPFRCRRAAETHYSLEVGCKSQIELYNKLACGSDGLVTQISAQS